MTKVDVARPDPSGAASFAAIVHSPRRRRISLEKKKEKEPARTHQLKEERPAPEADGLLTSAGWPDVVHRQHGKDTSSAAVGAQMGRVRLFVAVRGGVDGVAAT